MRHCAALLLLSACNKPPEEPSVAIEPAEPYTTDDLVVSIVDQAADPNGDSISYSYAWSRDGTARSDVTGDTVTADKTVKGEIWEVTVTPNDGTVDGEPSAAFVTVLNSPPAAEVTIEPGEPLASDLLLADVTVTDDDDDEVSLRYSWTVNGSATAYDEDNLPAEATAKGEVWEVTVTPTDNEEDGVPVVASVVIENSAPAATAVVISPDPAYEADVLQADAQGDDEDGDEISWSYAWYVDDALVQDSSDSTLTGASFDKHQQVYVRATPSDGLEAGEGLDSASITIQNTAPSITNVTLDPEEIYGDSSVSCAAAGWSDDDGDAEGYLYAWTVDGAEVSAAETLDGSSFARGDELVCIVTPSDGEDEGEPVSSDASTVLNSPPSIDSATLSTTSPTESDTISVTIAGEADVDNDTITWGYDWNVNGVSVSSIPTLDGTYFDKGDTIWVVVTPTDGTDDGAAVTSDSATAVNSPPAVSAITLSPSDITTDDEVTANFTASDADGETVSLGYEWYVDGSLASTASSLDGGIYFDKGQEIYVTVTPSDGEDYGSSVTSSATTVVNSPPSAPSVSISPSDPEPGVDDLVCTVDIDSSDDDGDSISYSFSWTLNSAPHADVTTTHELGDTVRGIDTADAQTWICSVTPNDGEEDGTAGTAALDIGGGTGGCEYPDVGVTNSAGPASGPTFSPSTFGVRVFALVEDSVIYDWEYGSSQESAYIEFVFTDAASNECGVVYDIDGSPFTFGWTTDSGGTLYDSFDLELSNGYTYCTAVSASTWGSTDLRDVVEYWEWGFGFGEMVDLTSSLAAAVLAAGYDWTNDWEPYVISGYLWWDLPGQAYEVDYVWGYEEECGVLEETAGDLVEIPAPTSGPLPDGGWYAQPFMVFTASYLIP